MQQRKTLRLRHYDYARTNWYFVTIKAFEGLMLFGEIIDSVPQLNPVGLIVCEEWKDLQKRLQHVRLDEFVVMPNHLHGIIMIERTGNSIESSKSHGLLPASLGSVISQFKSRTVKRVRKKTSEHVNLWQRNYYESILRTDIDIENRRRYIRENPVRW